MLVVEKIAELRKVLDQATTANQSIGFVPTMGYFHEGHLALMREAKQENDMVVVSLFVNPLQFGPQEDLQKYPRDLERDQMMASTTGVDILFVPDQTEMYPLGFQTHIEVTEVSQGMCSGNRPGHFRGVATVVLKLFNIVKPDRAYFGEKDAQQLRVIKQMVSDLNLDLEVVGCSIIRETDGLAMSSRNIYLSKEEREAALVLYQTLTAAQKLIAEGLDNATQLQQKLTKLIEVQPLAKLDYLVIVNSKTLEPLETLKGEVLIALAVRIGKTRLIDNMVYGV